MNSILISLFCTEYTFQEHIKEVPMAGGKGQTKPKKGGRKGK
jgi:hypothetical protein